MLILFWPFTILSIFLSLLSLVLKKPYLLIISTFLFTPMSLYLAATPLFFIWGLIFPGLYLFAVFLMRKKYNTWYLLLLISPNYFLIGWLGYAVRNQ
ncbi:hypothetical protein [Gottfriedia acidiceleris]|uniref:hypothetical protein n=1 Tax=Gottfriedia acidiceleris TaxID=371036 RepID=UPI000B43F6B8|nr:hypothetical protein [Gottfriedia acidiceleris]